MFGFPGFLGFSPGGMMPYDWPSMYGILPSCWITTWHVSPFAVGPEIFSTETILPSKGAAFLNVLIGIVDMSWYGSNSRKFWASSPPEAVGLTLPTNESSNVAQT